MKKYIVSSATSIKTKFSNSVHQLLEPNLGVKKSQRYRYKKVLTDAEKIALFDKIVTLHDAISSEYTECLYKNRQKKQVQKLRDENGTTQKRMEKRKAGKLFNHVD